MADWRDRGFVPDSDDEDEEADVETQDTRSGQAELNGSIFHDAGHGRRTCKGTDAEDDVSISHEGSPVREGLQRSSSRSPNTPPDLIDASTGLIISTASTGQGAPENTQTLSKPSGGTKPLDSPRPVPKDREQLGEVSIRDEDIGRGAAAEDIRADFSKHATGHNEEFKTIRHESDGKSVSSRSSSPLTELPSTPVTERFLHNASPSPTSWRNVTARQSPDQGTEPSSTLLPGRVVTQVRRAIAVEIMRPSPPARALRQRNPIQLHPYMLESERYRQFLKARGVKPLRITQAEAEAEAESGGVDSQERDLEDHSTKRSHGDHEDPLFEVPSSPFASQGDTQQPTNNSPHDEPTSPDPLADGDEFPDVDSLLRGPLSDGVRDGQKRRKTSHKYGRRAQSASHGANNATYSSTGRATGRDTVMLDADDIFEIPPSPPPSGSLSSHGSNKVPVSKFRFPDSRTPVRPQTPVTSSEPTRGPVIELSEDSESEAVVPTRSQTTSARSSRWSSPVLDRGQAHQLERVQRKIRGVLPASWLRLDLRTQAGRLETHARRDHRSPSPSRPQSHRGVARRVAVPRHRSPIPQDQSFAAVLISDDSDDSTLEDTTRLRDAGDRTISSRRDQESQPAMAFGEVEEDNRIDAMLPSQTRRNATGHPQKKRQTKLLEGRRATNIRPSSTRYNLFVHRTSELSHQPQITKHLSLAHTSRSRTSKKHKPVIPELSVLDAQPTVSSRQGTTPQFIRLATRQARSRRDKGRHSPSRKFIRLENRRDTEDVRSVLRDWREGTIAPKPQVSINRGHIPQSRKPLDSVSGNTNRIASVPASPKQPESSHAVSNKPTLPITYDRVTNPSTTSAIRKQTSAPQPLPRTLHSRSSKAWLPYSSTLKTARGQGRLLSSLQRSNGPRLAQLESRESGRLSGTTIEKVVSRGNVLSTRNNHGSTPPNLPLSRFLEAEESTDIQASRSAQQPIGSGNQRDENVRIASRLAHRPRKRRPRRLDADAVDFRQPVVQIHGHETNLSSGESVSEDDNRAKLYELAPFGTVYTTDFDIAPLAVGTFFYETTFIGSGEFAKSLKFTISRDMDVPAGVTVYEIDDKTLKWGVWNEIVSSEMGWAFDWVGRLLSDSAKRLSPGLNQANSACANITEVARFLRLMIRYYSQTLSFIDPIDRSSFTRRCSGLLSILADQLRASPSFLPQDDTAGLAYVQEHLIQSTGYTLVLANQLRQVTLHEMVDAPLKTEVEQIVQRTASEVVSMVCGSGFPSLRTFLEDNRYHAKREAGIREDNTSLEVLVIINHVLQQANLPNASIWDFKYRRTSINEFAAVLNVQSLETHWYDLFTLLPLLEFDESGILEVGRRFRASVEGWSVVKPLVSHVLEISKANPQRQSATFNSYLRALLHRCLHLIKGWGWRKCEVIVGTLFDFFAHNNLAHLCHEEAHGSPRFLQELDIDPGLEPDPDDRCYHILLKIIGTGLKAMRHVYLEKKIRDIAWRLMPNHGRLHPKDKPVRQEDLEALRNHHDLLCTIYWASPPGFRPRLDVIRNLVHPATSHREACHINIRAWSNLIRFQLSTDEPVASLVPFTTWHEDFTQQMLLQHSLARGEAEAQFRSAASTGNKLITRELLESTIAANQRQVEAVVSDALQSLKTALSTCRSAAFAKALLSKASTVAVFELFDVKQPRVNSLVLHALDIVLEYTRLCKDRCASNELQQASEESQEYGDWSVFDDVAEQDPKHEAIEHLHSTVYDGLARLVSNCFGADATPDDTILVKVIDTWTSVAQLMVSKDIKQWSNYVRLYSPESWSSLRSTEQTRKYTAYFMSKVIEEDPRSYEANKSVFLHLWMCCLVERESLLKFQHRLTNALLNVDPSNELFANLPFYVDSHDGRYSITATDFRARRLSLISSVLSNMRQTLMGARNHDRAHYSVLLQESRDLLRHLMASMKSNYQELGHGTTVRGAYVDFVHRVVEFLQQHISDICPIDKFFTDSSAFPLPATDPAYVVGRMKSYGVRLADSRTPKQLVAFLQTVTERAAVDNQQTYLVEQLYLSMIDAFETGDASNPTLRSFLMEAVFPAYISSSFDTPTAWLLAKPILEAIQRMYGHILEDVDGADGGSTDSFMSMTTTLLDSMREALEYLVDHLELLQEPVILNTIASFIATTTATLPALNYIHRLTHKAPRAVECIRTIASFATFVVDHLSDRHTQHCEDDPSPPIYTTPSDPDFPPLPSRFPGTLHFATTELRKSLTTNWVAHEGRYFVLRGNVRREVYLQLDSADGEMGRVFFALREFGDVVPGMSSFAEVNMEEDESGVEGGRWSGVHGGGRGKEEGVVF